MVASRMMDKPGLKNRALRWQLVHHPAHKSSDPGAFPAAASWGSTDQAGGSTQARKLDGKPRQGCARPVQTIIKPSANTNHTCGSHTNRSWGLANFGDGLKLIKNTDFDWINENPLGSHRGSRQITGGVGSRLTRDKKIHAYARVPSPDPKASDRE